MAAEFSRPKRQQRLVRECEPTGLVARGIKGADPTHEIRDVMETLPILAMRVLTSLAALGEHEVVQTLGGRGPAAAACVGDDVVEVSR